MVVESFEIVLAAAVDCVLRFRTHFSLPLEMEIVPR